MSIHLLTRLYQKTNRCIALERSFNNSLYINGLLRSEVGNN